MRLFIAVLLLISAAGCSGFAVPTSAQLDALGLPGSTPRIPVEGQSRLRIRMSVDSPSFAGEFEGVVLAKQGNGGPVVRMQLLGDVGPKTLDLLARPDRITGYFPQTREAVDCSLPKEAAPHPLLFMGASLIEKFTPVTRDRVSGIREEEQGRWLNLRPAIAGMTTQVFQTKSGSLEKRRHSWMVGVGWEEEWTDADTCTITGPKISIHVKILEWGGEPPAKAAVLELALPPDVRIVAGSRK